MRNERRVVEGIIRINPLLGALQEKIEREQDKVIADLVSPAEKVVEKLIELDNRRIDLCNLNVLYGFIERGLGERFAVLRACAFAGAPCSLYPLAAKQLLCADYTTERAEKEFDYLFKQLKRRRKTVLPTGAEFSSACAPVEG